MLLPRLPGRQGECCAQLASLCDWQAQAEAYRAGSNRTLTLPARALAGPCAAAATHQPRVQPSTAVCRVHADGSVHNKPAPLLLLPQIFLEDPASSTQAMPLAEKRRKHVHRILDSAAPGLVSWVMGTAGAEPNLPCMRRHALWHVATPPWQSAAMRSKERPPCLWAALRPSRCLQLFGWHPAFSQHPTAATCCPGRR